MASVYELIAASEAQREESPIVGIAKALAGGFDSYRTARSSALQDLLRKTQMQQMQQEMAMKQAAEQRKAVVRAQDAANEETIQQSLRATSVAPPPVLNTQKLEKFYDEEGNVRKSYTNKDLNDLLVDEVASGTRTTDSAFRTRNSSGGGFAVKPPAPPAGYRFLPDGTLEPIPGGPADEKKKATAAASQQAESKQAEQVKTISSQIEQALKLVGPTTAGFGGNVLGKVPGSKATDLQAVLDGIKANLGFDQLQAMKSGSKNGSSGLGALSDNELKLLSSLSGSLDRHQSPPQLKATLTQLKNKYAGFSSALGIDGAEDDGIGWSDAEEQELRALEAEAGGR